MYLAIDFGTYELTALLVDPIAQEFYPLSWQDLDSGETLSHLKTAVFYSFRQRDQRKQALSRRSSFFLGASALEKQTQQTGIFLEGLKPYLNIAIPYYKNRRGQWEPKLQQSPERVLPLYWIQKATQSLFTALTPDCETVGFKVQCESLEPEKLDPILSQLQGVILSYPFGWGESYRFNLREILLGAKLVQQPEQVIFVENAIASLLASLPLHPPHPTEEPQSTLLIEIGAMTTDLLWLSLPSQRDSLRHQDCTVEGFAYGELAFDQDLLYHLIYPQWLQNPQQPLMNLGMDFPPPGIPAPAKRDTVFLRLQGSDIGRSLLKALVLVKQVLRKQPQFTAQLGEQSWGVSRTQLHHQLLKPYLEQLNQSLNRLLAKSGASAQGIETIICRGHHLDLIKEGLSDFLTQKCPNAELVYPRRGQETEPEPQDYLHNPLTFGLGAILLYPQLINRFQHQYSDYFLFIELLKILPKYMFTWEDLEQKLLQRGINAPACQGKMIEFLEGKIPQGLIPSPQTCLCLADYSQHSPDYSGLLTLPFCTVDAQGYYHPDLEQCQKLRQFLGKVLSSHQQKLTEPLGLELSDLSSPLLDKKDTYSSPI